MIPEYPSCTQGNTDTRHLSCDVRIYVLIKCLVSVNTMIPLLYNYQQPRTTLRPNAADIALVCSRVAMQRGVWVGEAATLAKG